MCFYLGQPNFASLSSISSSSFRKTMENPNNQHTQEFLQAKGGGSTLPQLHYTKNKICNIMIREEETRSPTCTYCAGSLFTSSTSQHSLITIRDSSSESKTLRTIPPTVVGLLFASSSFTSSTKPSPSPSASTTCVYNNSSNPPCHILVLYDEMTAVCNKTLALAPSLSFIATMV